MDDPLAPLRAEAKVAQFDFGRVVHGLSTILMFTLNEYYNYSLYRSYM